MEPVTTSTRTRWAAVGAALAVTVGSGGLMSASATIDSGPRSVFVPITPCRVMDTRGAPDTVGPRTAPLGQFDTYSIAVLGTNGNCTIAGDAVGLSLNVTAVNPTGNSYLTVFPSDVSRPTASNLNWVTGQAPVPNAVTTDVSGDGRISFFNNAGTVDVVVDILGYYVDHNHDDRYYTKDQTYTRTEIDAALATKAVKLTGRSGIVVPAATLTPDHPLVDYSIDDSSGRLNMLDVACYLSAPLALPLGSTVVTLSAHVFDGNPSTAVVNLWRDVPGPASSQLMATTSSVGASGNQTLITDVIANPNVDTAHYISMCGDAGIGLYDAQVTFDYP